MMIMRIRDEAIISDLVRFRAMTREHISKLHFSNVKNPVKDANEVLLRLKRDGHISCSKERRMYTYYPAKSIKKNSSKLQHYLSIVDFYCDLVQYKLPFRFDVEPKIGGKGCPEPDVFTVWNKTLFFVEIQRSDYSQKQWQEKMNRYTKYYLSNEWHTLDWQKEEPRFPILWIVGKGPGMIPGIPFKVYHSTVEEMNNMIEDMFRKKTVKVSLKK